MSDSKRTSIITTPIYYVNDVPHVGHAYTTIAADTLARARRLAGQDVFFLTGTDEHGQNIERIAREKGISEQEHCDRISGAFRSLWERYGIRYDRFIRTTEDLHRRGVLKLWALLREARTPDGREAVYLGRYAGWYCPRCEGFKDEDELRQPNNVCPDHERPCEWTEEENFFFRLSAYESWLRDEIESDRLLIRPESRKNEILGVIKQGLKDFSVSRARVKWGIPVPEQPEHVLYVWVDALSNYITALGFADDAEAYRRYWAGGDERLHLLGKDIIRFHCLYWPAMLHAAGVPVPTREFAQGFITRDGRKLSKTTGNVIDPVALVERLGPDAARYFLLRDAPYGADWDFTDSAFVGRYNADLANDLGNLVSRAITMAARYCDGKVPQGTASTPAESLAELVLGRYEAIDFAGALTEIWSWVSQLNQAIVQFEPWVVAKDPARRDELEFFLYRLLEALRMIAVLSSPVMPGACMRILGMLGLGEQEPGPADLVWGRLVPGQPLGTITPLFPRVDKPAPTELPAEPVAAAVVPEVVVASPEVAARPRKVRRDDRKGPATAAEVIAMAAAAMSQGATTTVTPATAEAAGDGLPAAPPAEGEPADKQRPARSRRSRSRKQKETDVSDTTLPEAKKPEPAATPAGSQAAAAPLAAPPFGGVPATVAVAPAPAAAAAAGDRIDISEFGKVELRAARILAAEKIAGSKKLIKLQVELGSEQRQVVAGIADSYAPEALVGRTIILVANLKPAKLMGVESNGMVLAGSIEGKAVLCTFEAEVAPGTKVK